MPSFFAAWLGGGGGEGWWVVIHGLVGRLDLDPTYFVQVLGVALELGSFGLWHVTLALRC